MSRRSRSMARMRSLTDPYIVSRAPDKIAAAVMSTTGATIAWIAVTAIGFISPAYESSAGQNLLLNVRPSRRYAVPVRLPALAAAAPLKAPRCQDEGQRLLGLPGGVQGRK